MEVDVQSGMVCDVSPYGTTGTVVIKSYLQISQNRALMIPLLKGEP